MAFLNLHIRIGWHRIVIFNIVLLVIIAFMIVKHSFRLFIVRLIHDLVLNLLNYLNFCGFSKFPFVVPLYKKWLNRKKLNPGRGSRFRVRIRVRIRYSYCMTSASIIARVIATPIRTGPILRLKAVFQWCVFFNVRLRTCAQYASMNEFTCSEHSVRIRT